MPRPHAVRRAPRAAVLTLLVPVAVAVAAPTRALAQMPGVPVLQNAWANPGITVAANIGSDDASQAGAVAAAWAPSSGRFQVSGGVGLRDSDVGGQGATFGVRATVPIFNLMGGALGVAGFAGAGAAREPDFVVVGEDGVATVTSVPVGLAFGYRRALPVLRGASLYAAPFYQYNRRMLGDSTASEGLFRVSVGLDVGITSRIGLTVGGEFGGSSGPGEPGPTGAGFGVGGSYALGRRG